MYSNLFLNRWQPHLYNSMWGQDWLRFGRQEVGKCSTRGGSRGMYVTFASAQIANKAEPTPVLNPRGDVTKNPKQGYQWPQKRTCVSAKNVKTKRKKKQLISCHGAGAVPCCPVYIHAFHCRLKMRNHTTW